MATGDRGNRPLSPHLTIYRPQLTSITSILIRITGNSIILSVMLIVWWLFAAATSRQYFEVADAIMNSWFGKLVLISSLWAVFLTSELQLILSVTKSSGMKVWF